MLELDAANIPKSPSESSLLAVTVPPPYMIAWTTLEKTPVLTTPATATLSPPAPEMATARKVSLDVAETLTPLRLASRFLTVMPFPRPPALTVAPNPMRASTSLLMTVVRTVAPMAALPPAKPPAATYCLVS